MPFFYLICSPHTNSDGDLSSIGESQSKKLAEQFRQVKVTHFAGQDTRAAQNTAIDCRSAGNKAAALMVIDKNAAPGLAGFIQSWEEMSGAVPIADDSVVVIVAECSTISRFKGEALGLSQEAESKIMIKPAAVLGFSKSDTGWQEVHMPVFPG